MTAKASWRLVARDLALDQAAVDTVAVLRSAGIDALLIKGPVTASRLYAAEAHSRHYCDVDLLVAPADFDAAERALAEAGYRPANAGLRSSEHPWREAPWLTPGPIGVPIDLHRALAWVDDPEALWTALWRDHTSVTMLGSSIPAPDLVGTALIVAMHAGRPGASEQPYRDLSRAVELFNDTQWSSAVELAREVGAIAGFAFGFDSVPAARPLLRRLGLYAQIPTVMRMHTPGLSPAGAAIRRVLAAESPWELMRIIATGVWPSPAYMRRKCAAYDIGHVDLMTAHVQRWSRLFSTLPQGLAEFRRARSGNARRDRWTGQALTMVRCQLASGGLEQVELPGPGPAFMARDVEATLDGTSASCLERALVRQRFYAAHGWPRDLVIGVSPPGQNFHAHAWLAGDFRAEDALPEILRRPAPERWLGQLR